MSAATTDTTAIAADGHTYGRLDGHKDTWTDPHCIVIKKIFSTRKSGYPAKKIRPNPAFISIRLSLILR